MEGLVNASSFDYEFQSVRLSQLVKACESLPLLFLRCQIHFLVSNVSFAYCFLSRGKSDMKQNSGRLEAGLD